MQKLGRMIQRVVGSIERACKGVAAVVGVREVALLAGLALVGYGAGLVYWPAGFALPGAILVYVSIAGLAS